MIFVDRTLYPKGELLSPVLDENTWEQISNASAEGTGKNYWSVGDCKKIHVEGVIGRSKDPDYCHLSVPPIHPPQTVYIQLILVPFPNAIRRTGNLCKKSTGMCKLQYSLVQCHI